MIIIVGAAGADINITNIEERFCDNWDYWAGKWTFYGLKNDQFARKFIKKLQVGYEPETSWPIGHQPKSVVVKEWDETVAVAQLEESLPVWPDLAIYWTLGNFLKPLATINLPKSSTFLGNVCEGVKIYHFSS